MTITDEELGRQLRAEVGSIEPSSGLRLDRIQRGGRRRVVRQRAVRVACGAVLTAAAVTVVTVWSGGSSLTPPAAPGPGGAQPPVVTEERTLRLADDFTNALRDAGAEPGQGVVAADAESVGDLVDDGPEQTSVTWHARWETGQAPDRRTTLLRIEASDGEFVPVIDCVEHPEATRGCTEQVLDDGTRVISGETSHREPGNAGLPIWQMWSPQAVAIHPDGRQVWLQVQLEVRDGDPVPPGDRLDDYSGPLTLEQMREIVQRPEWAELPLP